MWSVEYVQVPKELPMSAQEAADAAKGTDGKGETSPTSAVAQSMTGPRKLSRHSSCEGYNASVRRLSRRESCDSYSDGKPAADMLRDFKDPDYLAAIDCEMGSSGEHDSPLTARLRDEDRDSWRNSTGSSIGESFRYNVSATSSTGDLYRTSGSSSMVKGSSIQEGVGEADKASLQSASSVSVEVGADAAQELGADAGKHLSGESAGVTEGGDSSSVQEVGLVETFINIDVCQRG